MTPTQGPYPNNIKGGEIWVMIQPIPISLLLASVICVRGTIPFYYIDTSVLLENILLVKFIKTTSGTRVVYFP